NPYTMYRFHGSYIIIDENPNNTGGPVMAIERISKKDRRPPVADDAVPRATNIWREEARVTTDDRERLLGQRAVTIWLTGLPSSGKSSIAKEAERRLHEAGRHVCVLDGDNLRFGLNRDLAFSKADRAENIRRAAEVARLFNDAGSIVLVPVISPFREDRERARAIIGPERFVEVYLNTSLAVCEERDVKGLYRRAGAAEIGEFPAISSPSEPPEQPSLVIDTAGQSLAACVDRLWQAIEDRIRR